jgi:hypothetical protein
MATNDIGRAEALMRLNQVRRSPVVDACGHVKKVLSLSDIAEEAQREESEKRVGFRAASVVETLATICRHRNESRFSVELKHVE